MHQRGSGKVSAAASVSASASASHALTTTFPTSRNALAGGGGGQGRDCPTKLSVQVSSASSAAVRPRARVPRALTSSFPTPHNALAGGQVSSASSAAVHPRARVPQALTSLFPDDAQCVSRWRSGKRLSEKNLSAGEFRVVRRPSSAHPRPAISHLSLPRQFSSGSSSSAASVQITRQVIDDVTPAFPYNKKEEQDAAWRVSGPPPGAAPHDAASDPQLHPYPSQEEGTATTTDDIQPPPPAPPCPSTTTATPS